MDNSEHFNVHNKHVALLSISATIAQSGQAALFDFPVYTHKKCTKLGECHCGLYQEVNRGHA